MAEDIIMKNRVNLKSLEKAIEKINQELHKVLVGQQEMVNLIITAILANGHILLEGVPGIAKTLTAKLVAKTLAIQFSRIQFTPDLMPSDIIGTNIFNIKKSNFEFKKGPVFANLILIDEINRSPAKTQAALFEVMQEKQITVDGTCYALDDPFIVIATQNPIEYEGTYRLPEAQIDRFLFKIKLDYPSLEEEIDILTGSHERKTDDLLEGIKTIIKAEHIKLLRNTIKSIHIENNLIKYIAEIVQKTRNNNSLYLGASPRASLAILNGSKAFAAINGRDFVIPEDIRTIAFPALCHRLILNPEKEMEGKKPEDIIKSIIDDLEVPR